jgi:signal transduction histidine kinase/ActR/RegA family two-component response regulator
MIRNMKNLTTPDNLRRRFVTALLLAYLGVAIGLAIVVPYQLQAGEHRWLATLSSTAVDRARILDNTLQQRLGEVAVLAASRSAVQVASRDPTAVRWTGPGPSPAERLTPLLSLAYQKFSLAGVFVVDRESATVLSVGSHAETVPGLSLYVAAAFRHHKAVFVDMFQNASGANRVAYVAPLVLENGEPAGAMVAVEDPAVTLFPGVRSASLVMSSAQSAVERKSYDGNVAVVQQLWQESGAASGPKSETPYADASVVEQAAADGRSASALVRSAGDVPRIMATAHVPSSGWGVVVTVNASEALADIRVTALLEAFLMFALTTAVIVLITLQGERSRRSATEFTIRSLSRKNAEIEELSRIMTVTREVNQLISHETDIQEVTTNVCRHVLGVGDFQTSWIALCHDDTIAVEAKAGMTSIVPRTVIKVSDLEHGRPCVFRALTAREPVFVTASDRSICVACEHRDTCPSSETFVGPLISQDEVLGVFVISSLTVHAVGSGERSALAELTDDVAFAIASQRVREQKTQAEAALRQAQKMQAVGQLAGGVAHDFNNLLTGIIGNVDIALHQAGDDPGVARPLEDAAMAARKAAELTGKLLAFGRKAVVVPSSIDIGQLVDDALVLLERSLPASIHIVRNEGAGIWPVKVDASQMTQVLVNLAINARDAMHGKGTLTIEAANCTTDDDYVAAHPYAHVGDYVSIVVRDTGEGMTSQVKAHVFEPFFTTKPAGQGTGLGLSMAYGAVKQAGGWIEIDSDVGRGTAVTVFLPCSTEAVTTPLETPRAQAELPRGTETVLVVDDEDIVRALARRVLERFGYTVLTAVDGEDAMEQFRSRSDAIDLVISDLTMPGMTGVDCLNAMRAVRPDIAFVLSSGYSVDTAYQDLVQGPLASAGFIAKPYTPQELLTIARSALDTTAAARSHSPDAGI